MEDFNNEKVSLHSAGGGGERLAVWKKKSNYVSFVLSPI